MSSSTSDAEAGQEAVSKPASTEAALLNGAQAIREESPKDLSSNTAPPAPAPEPELPKLTPTEFRVYNELAERMDYFHNHFRQTWNLLYTACKDLKRPSSMSLRQFLNTGLQFCSHLSTHHAIEEQHVFPNLARKMPEFKNSAELLKQHEKIHEGMDIFEEYLRMCLSGETELDLRVMREKMDSWGEVLWMHLDQEVRTLGAENMRKYWSKEEMKQMPM